MQANDYGYYGEQDKLHFHVFSVKRTPMSRLIWPIQTGLPL